MLELEISDAERRMEVLLNRVERGEIIAILDRGVRRAMLRPTTSEERTQAEQVED